MFKNIYNGIIKNKILFTSAVVVNNVCLYNIIPPKPSIKRYLKPNTLINLK
jgi:hypothetical protein